jgi:hypothetical protein
MLIQSQAGSLPSSRQSAGTPNNPAGGFGEALMSELAPQYYTLLKAGRVFTVSSLAVNPAAFVGAAAGTPLIGLYNPVASGVDLVMLQARIVVRTTGTAAASTGLSFFACNQGGVAVTGTQTQCRNMYSQANTGSVIYAMVNTANTAALASTLVAPSLSIGTVTTTPGVIAGNLVDEIRGVIVLSPGCYLAYGLAAALTAGSLDASLMWAEIPA